jgi:hypothetical protein
LVHSEETTKVVEMEKVLNDSEKFDIDDLVSI